MSLYLLSINFFILSRFSLSFLILHQLISGGVAGSDFPAIFPVILWLIKLFHQRREECTLQHQRFALLQYSKTFRLPGQEFIENSWKCSLISKPNVSPAAVASEKCSKYSSLERQEGSIGNFNIIYERFITMCAPPLLKLPKLSD